MFSMDDERWSSRVSLVGALLWAVLAALAGSGIAPLGVIELLFLFAPVVAVPAALALLEMLSTTGALRIERIARSVQPLAALSLVLGFWRGPGTIGGLLSVPWAIVCGGVALAGLIQVRRISLATLVGCIARLDLGIGGIFLLLSRFGIHLQFQEPIILLTAVHFHYSGFVTSTIALAGLRFADRSNRRLLWQSVAFAVAVLPFCVATGFVFSPVLKVVSAAVFSAAVAALACLLLAESWRFSSRTARFFVGLAAASVTAGMSLATIYAVGEYLGRSWITIPRMASTHGWINALGFAMPALLGCLAELRAQAEALPASVLFQPEGGKINRAKIARPRFIARDFYDL